MFILSNYNQKAPFKVSKSNNLDVIESQVDNLAFFSIERNSPVQFFCTKHNTFGAFSRDELIPAKYFTVETIFEKEAMQKDDATHLYNNLITDFGDDKSKERVAKRSLVSYLPNESITFNIENQLIPPFDREAESPKDAYSVDLMFDKDVIDRFEAMRVDINDLSDFVRSIYTPDQKRNMLILDCIFKMLSERTIGERLLRKYRFFYSSIKDDLIKGKLPALLRDKYVIVFYVVLLIVSGFEINLEQIPRFLLTQDKVVAFLKMIGCTINKMDKCDWKISQKIRSQLKNRRECEN
ncbi:uncharacterized protein VICG_01705 [Vittaforma corneae ATCC 50505]|uniref:Uncharacterized protein n=1 Tax=Vittaforma corneae (strain ATCC 50505) TaxID=993615 RepID=L2GK44_VITCO|nr:uncharacterized protein VICG_01705 [Vittaforma corneae ATCC 50505]ELA41216.1 hypothetical protein VICG_01705 [Vittaforma corneae ATCC 50505]